MKRFRWLLPVAVLAVGCGSGNRSLAPEVAAERAVEVAPDRRAIEALEALGLSPEQRTKIRALTDRVEAAFAASAGPRREVVASVVEGIATGRLDPTRVNRSVGALVAATNDARPAVIAGLNELHGILTPAQRKQLLESLAKRGKGKDGADERGKKMAEALDLTFSQKIELASVLGEGMKGQKEEIETLKADLKAAAESFEGEGFDAAQLAVLKKPVIEY